MKNNILDSGRRIQLNFPGLIICAALFVCGCIAGTFSAGFVTDSENLYGYFSDYFSLVSDGALLPKFLPVLFNASKYHLAAIFFGFSVIGFICVPVLSAVRGYFLCFSISSVVRIFAGRGVWLVLSMFGISALISIPCFFILVTQAFSSSLGLMRAANGLRTPEFPYGRGYLVRCALCLAILFVLALFETFLLPIIVAAAAPI